MRDLTTNLTDPLVYQNNPLIDACGPPLSTLNIAKRLVHLPPAPSAGLALPREAIDHHLAGLWRLHIPSDAGIGIARSIDVMMRQGYVHRNPQAPATWRRIYSQIGDEAAVSPVQLAATVTGLAGMGKTTAIERALQLYPQVVCHDSFPGLMGPVKQLLWLKVDVPASGKIRDLVEAFAHATDAALGTSMTEDLIGRRSVSGATLAHRWLQRISCHFPGIFVLDEVQNLFKIERKSVREVTSRRPVSARPALRIVDDESLKLVLTVTNWSKIPLMTSSTPDGLEAFNTRMSTSQRLLTAGLHMLPRPESPDDAFFGRHFVPALCRYQWLPRKIPLSQELRALLFELTAGIPRICVTLWIHAHQHAVRRGADGLDFTDFTYAAANALAPLRAAVRALVSGDPQGMRRYEDALGIGATRCGG